VHFVTKVSLYFWNLRYNSASFDTHEVHIVNKKFWTLIYYIVHDSKSHDQWWSGHWVPNKIFFAVFCTFGRYVTNLRGTFVENVKKVQNQPTLLYSVHCPSFLLETWFSKKTHNLKQGAELHHINATQNPGRTIDAALFSTLFLGLYRAKFKKILLIICFAAPALGNYLVPCVSSSTTWR
jgi:hypothetical protein